MYSMYNAHACDYSPCSTAVSCCYCGQCIGHDVCVRSGGSFFLKEDGGFVCDDCAPVVKKRIAAMDEEKSSVIIVDSEKEEEEEEQLGIQIKTEIDTQSFSEEKSGVMHCPLDVCFCTHSHSYTNQN